ncbi:MAG: hypothetical protein MUE44_21710 [Oscillatoriaceae cyanobacterium Prado104]|nr:hypothetical protein [Oscillatoriaceae cyanobacterium Prado104]
MPDSHYFISNARCPIPNFQYFIPDARCPIPDSHYQTQWKNAISINT